VGGAADYCGKREIPTKSICGQFKPHWLKFRKIGMSWHGYLTKPGSSLATSPHAFVDCEMPVFGCSGTVSRRAVYEADGSSCRKIWSGRHVAFTAQSDSPIWSLEDYDRVREHWHNRRRRSAHGSSRRLILFDIVSCEAAVEAGCSGRDEVRNIAGSGPIWHYGAVVSHHPVW